MKNTAHSILFVLLIIFSCTESAQYQVDGEITGYEGYVFVRYGDFVDSTLVADGAFTFTGSVDRTVQATITNKADGIYAAPFFLDNELVTIDATFEEPYIQMISVSSPSNTLVETVLSALSTIMEDEERLRSNELFLYMDSITAAHPRNDFIIELTTEVITSDFITFQQTNALLGNIDTLLIHPSDLKSMKIALDRQARINPGDQFPAFSFNGLAGEVYTKESFPDQYLLIDVWATWCGPCLEGFDTLLPIYEALNGQLEVLSVSIDSSKDRVIQFLEKNKLPWKQAHAEGEFNNPFMQELGIVFLPFYYLLTPEGEIIAINPAIEDIPELIKRRGSLKEVMK